MSETADALVLDLVEWVARQPRPYAEVIATWRTSCPRAALAQWSWSPKQEGNCCARTAVCADGGCRRAFRTNTDC